MGAIPKTNHRFRGVLQLRWSRDEASDEAFEDWVEIFYPRYLMRCVEIKDTVLNFLCLILKKGLAMHPLPQQIHNTYDGIRTPTNTTTRPAIQPPSKLPTILMEYRSWSRLSRPRPRRGNTDTRLERTARTWQSQIGTMPRRSGTCG
jgi:hypothetical protein